MNTVIVGLVAFAIYSVVATKPKKRKSPKKHKVKDYERNGEKVQGYKRGS